MLLLLLRLLRQQRLWTPGAQTCLPEDQIVREELVMVAAWRGRREGRAGRWQECLGSRKRLRRARVMEGRRIRWGEMERGGRQGEWRGTGGRDVEGREVEM